MINGKRMNGDIGGQNDLNQLNPANIERIEIVKGAASSPVSYTHLRQVQQIGILRYGDILFRIEERDTTHSAQHLQMLSLIHI